MLHSHLLLPHAAFSDQYLHHDGLEDSSWTSLFSAPPPAVSRPEEVSAPSAQMFPNKFLCLLDKSERNQVENPALP